MDNDTPSPDLPPDALHTPPPLDPPNVQETVQSPLYLAVIAERDALAAEVAACRAAPPIVERVTETIHTDPDVPIGSVLVRTELGWDVSLPRAGTGRDHGAGKTLARAFAMIGSTVEVRGEKIVTLDAQGVELPPE